MKKRLVLSVLLAVCFSALEAVDLIKDGKIAFDAVVLSPRAFPMMKTAAEELVYHLKLATGETLPVITDDKVKKDGKPDSDPGKEPRVFSLTAERRIP